ncbi:SAM-dependent methyltransferase [Tsuneonella mangrovi]|uniref:SAM-dependent methyltransferase n=1 Tax=Tsuneonella mangrovi TaxID=1982042 RepID=UPI000BA26A0D|nr:cyclopropane-fatty-acyl-phospholipid synthase family protein [Tsuneonella mangrovi]
MRAEGNIRGKGLLDGGARFERKPGLFARLTAPSFHKILDAVDTGLDSGRIIARLPDGTTRMIGGRAPGFEAEVDIRDWRALLRLATNGSIGCYQGFEAGEWDSPDPVPLFALFMANGDALGDIGRARGPFRWAARFAHWLNRNTHAGSARNIQVHYDLGNDFYSLWLGETMAYSSARFAEGATSLDDAQIRKIADVSDRLAVGGGDEVLEIGCGWGALSRHIAEAYGASVTGISLSDEQLAWCRKSSSPENGSVEFRRQDYRDTNGRYDAIVSVEMVEALGREYWPTFMDCIARNLKPGGRAAIQYISMKDSLFDAYADSADFIQAYIFPGGLLIRSSEFRRLAEERGLWWTDQVDFGQDYAETLRCWRERFDEAAVDDRLPAGFDERFVRLWRFYLQYCEGGFRGGGIDVHQVTLVKED